MLMWQNGVKRKTLEYLICPSCLPEQSCLCPGNLCFGGEEIIEGCLACRRCGKTYPVCDGIACLGKDGNENLAASPYESPQALSTYLWTHYADLFGDPEVTKAYCEWAEQISPFSGTALDVGCATGRFSFEMSAKCDLVIGVDSSLSFVATARRIMEKRHLAFSVKEEGLIESERQFTLPPGWNSAKVDFVVADAEALPFRSGSFGCVASLNVIDKTPHPLEHMNEVCRVARPEKGQLLLSDPFSWSGRICPPENWLGGTLVDRFAGAGIDNVARLLAQAAPAWTISRRGAVWWKIRNHRNHFELIRSLFIKAQR